MFSIVITVRTIKTTVLGKKVTIIIRAGKKRRGVVL